MVVIGEVVFAIERKALTTFYFFQSFFSLFVALYIFTREWKLEYEITNGITFQYFDNIKEKFPIGQCVTDSDLLLWIVMTSQ